MSVWAIETYQRTDDTYICCVLLEVGNVCEFLSYRYVRSNSYRTEYAIKRNESGYLNTRMDCYIGMPWHHFPLLLHSTTLLYFPAVPSHSLLCLFISLFLIHCNSVEWTKTHCPCSHPLISHWRLSTYPNSLLCTFPIFSFFWSLSFKTSRSCPLTSPPYVFYVLIRPSLLSTEDKTINRTFELKHFLQHVVLSRYPLTIQGGGDVRTERRTKHGKWERRQKKEWKERNFCKQMQKGMNTERKVERENNVT